MNKFWQEKKLEQMTVAEWEQLCDGCAKCCLHKLEDEDSGEIYGTNVVCQYLDSESCHCQAYQKRSILVPECITMNRDNLKTVYFMPDTCAYRLLAEHKPLPFWHPLITQDKNSVHSSGHSVQGKVINELEVDDMMHHLTGQWD